MHLRKATGNLDKADCNMYMNEIIPFSHEEAGEATSEEKDRGSNIASSSSGETMIKDGVIVEEEERSQMLQIHGTDASYVAERNSSEMRPPSFLSQHYELYYLFL